MNREKHDGFIDTVAIGYDQFMKLYENSPAGSDTSARLFFKAHSFRDAGEAVKKTFAALPSTITEQEAWIACRDAVQRLSDYANNSIDAVPYPEDGKDWSPEVQSELNNLNSYIMGYDLALACLSNYK